MNTEDLRLIAIAFSDGMYGFELDHRQKTEYWNNCGFSYEVCI